MNRKQAEEKGYLYTGVYSWDKEEVKARIVEEKKTIRNKTTDNPLEWEENGFTFLEICKQEHITGDFSTGLIKGKNKPAEDTVYLRLEKEGDKPTTIFMRPDEMAAIAWVAVGLLWSHQIWVANK